MQERDFDLGDVLSITTSLLVSPRHIKGVYDILDFMSGENLFTHQLPRVAEEMRPVLFSQHPQLRAVDTSGISGPETVKPWLAEQKAIYGDTLTVSAPLRLVKPYEGDPIGELVDMMGADKGADKVID